MIALPDDVQERVFHIYKAGLRERYECSPHYLVDVVRFSCGELSSVVMEYMGHIVQQPHRKPHFAVVLTGPFADAISLIMRKVTGDGNWTMGDTQQLLGRFNGHLKGKQLVVIRGPVTPNALCTLKDILRSPSVIIEEPNRNATKVPSHHRLVLINPARDVSDGARRFRTVKCEDVGGFRAEVLESVDAVAGFVRYLRTV